ncbi:hypothetical protein V7S43_013570 [Phytophthora oleae]|uniref:Uncharacterized protein n=1 Tax=Phytophthora oleae TaxID=2107226 RepID=A0ABD3F3I5_9STRA
MAPMGNCHCQAGSASTQSPSPTPVQRSRQTCHDFGSKSPGVLNGLVVRESWICASRLGGRARFMLAPASWVNFKEAMRRAMLHAADHRRGHMVHVLSAWCCKLADRPVTGISGKVHGENSVFTLVLLPANLQ